MPTPVVPGSSGTSAPAAQAKPPAPSQVQARKSLPSWEGGDAPMSPQAAQRIVSDVVVQSPDADPAARALLSQQALNRFNPALRRRIQQALLEIYADDPAYMEAYREVTMPLSDNIVGPITLSWLNRFWFEFKMAPVSNLSDASVAALLRFAAIVKAHPEWKADLISAELGRWIDGFEAQDKARYYQIRLGGTDEQILAMLRLYHYDSDNNRSASPDPDSALLNIFSYSLSADDFKLLAAKSTVLAKLSALQDVVYLNEPLFDAAVLDALKELGPDAHNYLPIARVAALQQSYHLTLDNLQQLREGGVPEDILAALEALTATTYPNQAAFSEAVLDATPSVKSSIDPHMGAIIDAADTSNIYILNARALAELGANRRNEAVPQVILDMLKGLQGLEYANQWLFDKAVMARLRQGIGACPGGMAGNAALGRKISSQQMEQLARAIADPALFAQLDKLWKATSCSKIDELSMPQQIEALYIPFRASIRATARKHPAYDPAKQVRWNGNGCGCVLDELNGDVYGIYPFWHAGKLQQVDFSILSRIGYYGATFDDSGTLRQANDNRDFVRAIQNGNEFVKVARRHQTAIDWIIQRNDWRSWSRMNKGAKETVLRELSTNIVELMSIQLNGWDTRLSSQLPQWASFRPANGDGVTLLFDGYPSDDVSVAAFYGFIRELRQRLLDADLGDSVNVMMRNSAIGHGVYSYDKLSEMIQLAAKDYGNSLWDRLERGHRQALPRLLVLLEEETTESKKQLRLRAEDALHGEDRAQLLRRVVPVITFDNDNWQQLEDDIIYFKDNFGGIGFWTMPIIPPGPPPSEASAKNETVAALRAQLAPGRVPDCVQTQDISTCIGDYYQVNPGASTSPVCKTVCENLFAFRVATRLSFLFLLGCALAYYGSCRWREIMKRYRHIPALVLFALWFLLSLAMLFCDPFLHWLASGYMIPIFLVLLIVALIVWYQYQLKQKDEQP
ncbi:hypothetical protein ACTOWA_25255 [Herbaspirillum seropedicae]|uniref:hypothetical protein n=1 Tax=Herbaspirillum seropedicae TaxID=964 RepID=UPI003F8D55B7